MKMSFEKSNISRKFLYNHVTKDTDELRKSSTMPGATFHRNLKKLTQQGTIRRRQGNGRPRVLKQNDEKSICQKALIAL